MTGVLIAGALGVAVGLAVGYAAAWWAHRVPQRRPLTPTWEWTPQGYVAHWPVFIGRALAPMTEAEAEAVKDRWIAAQGDGHTYDPHRTPTDGDQA